MSTIKSSRLIYTFNGHEKTVDNPTANQIHDSILGLPPAAVILTERNQWLSKLIGWLSILRNPMILLHSGLKCLYSHTGVFLGSYEIPSHDDDMIVEALPSGVNKGHLKDLIASDTRVEVWFNKDLFPGTDIDMRLKLLSMVGKKYDWSKLLSFVVPIHQDPNAYICSEVVIDLYRLTGLIPHILEISTPADLADLFNSNEGFELGWRKILVWI